MPRAATRSQTTLAGVSAGRFRRRNYGRNHGYLLEGHKIISVTKVLNLGMPKDALIGWAAGTAARAAWNVRAQLAAAGPEEEEGFIRDLSRAHEKVRNTAGVKGTAVHAFGERLVHGERVEGIPDEVAPKVDAYVRFLNEWQVVPVVTERAICNLEVPYGGTFDIVFRSLLFPDRVFLGDIKTSKGVYGENALQLEAYERGDFYVDDGGAEVPMGDLGITDHVVIHLSEDRDGEGAYHVIAMERGDAPWDIFLSAVRIAQARSGERGETDMDALVLGELFRPGQDWF